MGEKSNHNHFFLSYPSLLFSCLIVWESTSITILNRTVGDDILVLLCHYIRDTI